MNDIIFEALKMQICINKASADVSNAINSYLEKYELSGESFLIAGEVLLECLATLLTTRTKDPKKILEEYFIPNLIDRVGFHTG